MTKIFQWPKLSQLKLTEMFQQKQKKSQEAFT